VVHGFLTTAYWSKGVPRETVARSMEHSLCFGAFDGDRQVGFARVISDRTTFAYICDVFALESHRKRGVGKSLMTAIMAHPELQGLRLWTFSRATRTTSTGSSGSARLPTRSGSCKYTQRPVSCVSPSSPSAA